LSFKILSGFLVVYASFINDLLFIMVLVFVFVLLPLYIYFVLF